MTASLPAEGGPSAARGLGRARFVPERAIQDKPGPGVGCLGFAFCQVARHARLSGVLHVAAAATGPALRDEWMNPEILCRWLGLPNTCWPPDPHTLLGLAAGEQDPAKIEHQVQERMSRLRGYQI